MPQTAPFMIFPLITTLFLSIYMMMSFIFMNNYNKLNLTMDKKTLQTRNHWQW